MWCIEERKQRRNKISISKGEEQQRDEDGGGETNKQTRRDAKLLWKRVSWRNRKGWKKIERITCERQKKRIIKNEANEEKSPIGIKKGQGNKKQEKPYINSATD